MEVRSPGDGQGAGGSTLDTQRAEREAKIRGGGLAKRLPGCVDGSAVQTCQIHLGCVGTQEVVEKRRGGWGPQWRASTPRDEDKADGSYQTILLMYVELVQFVRRVSLQGALLQ